MNDEHKAGEEEVREAEVVTDMAPSWKDRLGRFAVSLRSVQENRSIRRLRGVLLLVIGIVVGIAAKTEASQRITMGYQDYMVSPSAAVYDMGALEKKVAETQAASGGQAPSLPGGAACGQ